MATTTRKTSKPARYEVRFDGEEWQVIHPDGYVVAEFDAEAEALAYAAQEQAEMEADERSERVAALRDRVAGLIDDCDDEAKLAEVLAILRRK